MILPETENYVLLFIFIVFVALLITAVRFIILHGRAKIEIELRKEKEARAIEANNVLSDIIKKLIESKNKNIGVKLMEYIHTVHKYDIVFDFNIVEYMTVNSVSWPDMERDILASVSALDKTGSMRTSVVVLRRIVQGKEDKKLDYVFEELTYVK